MHHVALQHGIQPSRQPLENGPRPCTYACQAWLSKDASRALWTAHREKKRLFSSNRQLPCVTFPGAPYRCNQACRKPPMRGKMRRNTGTSPDFSGNDGSLIVNDCNTPFRTPRSGMAAAATGYASGPAMAIESTYRPGTPARLDVGTPGLSHRHISGPASVRPNPFRPRRPGAGKPSRSAAPWPVRCFPPSPSLPGIPSWA